MYHFIENPLFSQITGKPSAPGAPEPVDITNDSLTLFWKAPEDDGNTPIIEYILESQERTQTTWTQIVTTKTTTHTVTKLKTNAEYRFRVMAVNEVGPGPASTESPFIKIAAPIKKEAPVFQEPLTDVSIAFKQTVTLSCIISGTPIPKVQWYKNGTALPESMYVYENRVSKYIIQETTETSEGTYKCTATNECGTAETSCRLVIQEKPTILIDESLYTQRLRTGADWTIESVIGGYPKPEVKWYKNGTTVEVTSRNEIRTEQNVSKISVRTLERSDSGKYTVEATNGAGSAVVELNLNVIGIHKIIILLMILLIYISYAQTNRINRKQLPLPK